MKLDNLPTVTLFAIGSVICQQPSKERLSALTSTDLADFAANLSDDEAKANLLVAWEEIRRGTEEAFSGILDTMFSDIVLPEAVGLERWCSQTRPAKLKNPDDSINHVICTLVVHWIDRRRATTPGYDLLTFNWKTAQHSFGNGASVENP